MGLDMYLYAREKGTTPNPDIEPESIELGYWRKHRDLHRFIEQEWRDATSSEGEFNCVEFPLTKDLCIEILQYSTDKTLPEGDAGFFFGASTPEDREATIGFMHKAISHIDDGYDVFYNSWW